MSVNSRFSINADKVRKYGKFFKSIDFESNEYLAESEYLDDNKTATCGTFFIGNGQYDVTLQELRRIVSTAEAALETVQKNYKLKRLAQR